MHHLSNYLLGKHSRKRKKKKASCGEKKSKSLPSVGYVLLTLLSSLGITSFRLHMCKFNSFPKLQSLLFLKVLIFNCTLKLPGETLKYQCLESTPDQVNWTAASSYFTETIFSYLKEQSKTKTKQKA